MIHFFIRRYLFALLQRRLWLLLAFLPPLIYLGVSAGIPDRFLIYQHLSIPQDAKVPVSTSPVDIMPMSEFIEHPDDFFLDRYAIKEISEIISADTVKAQRQGPFRSPVRQIEEMSLGKLEGEKVRVAYYGADPNKGKKLVAYYSKRLVKKVHEGTRRSRLHGTKKSPEQQRAAPEAADMLGKIELEPERSLWRAERFVPSIQIFIVSLIALLLIIGGMEFIDPSLKSERQIARYLGIRSLGVLPNLNKLSRAIKK